MRATIFVCKKEEKYNKTARHASSRQDLLELAGPIGTKQKGNIAASRWPTQCLPSPTAHQQTVHRYSPSCDDRRRGGPRPDPSYLLSPHQAFLALFRPRPPAHSPSLLPSSLRRPTDAAADTRQPFLSPFVLTPAMADDDIEVPWGRYTYATDGLATGCYLEGGASDVPGKRRLRFRVELPTRCFVMSVSLKLSSGASLHDISVERTLNNDAFDLVHDGSSAPEPGDASASASPSPSSSESESDDDDGDEDDDERLRAKRLRAAKQKKKAAAAALAERKRADPTRKMVDFKRAADSLRLTMTDVDDNELAALRAAGAAVSGPPAGAAGAGDAAGAVRVLSVTVIGYTRGQTPPSKGLKMLLNVATTMIASASLADRAEVDGLLGLAFLGNRRYRQAAELLRRAADLSERVAEEDRRMGVPPAAALNWSAQLNLLAAYSFFEHVPLSNDGVSALMLVVAAYPGDGRSPSSSFAGTRTSPRGVRETQCVFLDLRTELLSSIDPLMRTLVGFMNESDSVAVQMASARLIEFIAEQLGCAVSPYISLILNEVIRSYQHAREIGPRERPAASTFSYDSFEECYERLIDSCCRMFPITEHSVLQKLFDHTIVPIVQEAFKESAYLFYEDGVEEESDELLCSAISHTLRVSYLILQILEGDAHVPSSFVTRVLNMLITENGIRRTPAMLRRTALHTWDALNSTLTLSASGANVKDFKEFLVIQKQYIGRLVVQVDRPSFDYEELEDAAITSGVEVFEEDAVKCKGSTVLRDVLEKTTERTSIIDRFTFLRLLKLIKGTCSSLQPCSEDDAMLTTAYVVLDLQKELANAIADVLMSSLVDVSYAQAASCGNGDEEINNHMESNRLETQVRLTCEILEVMFECFWSVVNLLPAAMAAEAEATSPVKPVLAWCAHRMRHSTPPPGMLCLLTSAVKGLNNELNQSMLGSSKDGDLAEGKITFIDLYRVHLPWLPQGATEDSLDFTDTLITAAAPDMKAIDVVTTIDALSDQTEDIGTRADVSLKHFATICAETTPRAQSEAQASLHELVNKDLSRERILAGFPKLASPAQSFSRRLRGSNAGIENPIMRSFYLHVVLSSCFDKFEVLGLLAKRDLGPLVMGEELDGFVENAVFLDRTLAVCTRLRYHRQYISNALGELQESCLLMQMHVDGRVRLAGFNIFAGALNILFLQQKKGAGDASSAGEGPASDGLSASSSTMPSGSDSFTGVSGGGGKDGAIGSVVTELSDADIDGEPSIASVSSIQSSGTNLGALQGAITQIDGDDGGEGVGAVADNRGQDETAKWSPEGGLFPFHADSTPPSRLGFEDRAWQMLCVFISSSLGAGTYVDFVVQRESLMYLKECLVNALCGSSSGVNVITLDAMEQLWDSVIRLVGSPWRTLNGLAFWVCCALINVSFFITITAKGRQAKTRASQLEEFALTKLFPAAEKFLRADTKETRLWGARLLEVYFRAREINPTAFDVSPAPQPRIMRQVDVLCHDWCEEIRDLAKALKDMYIDSSISMKNRTNAQGVPSFTQSSLTSMRRHLYRDSAAVGGDGVSVLVELWFPSIPKPNSVVKIEMYSRTLEAFANAAVAGGEEVDEPEEEEEEDGDDYYDDEEGEYDEEDEEESTGADEDGEGAEVNDDSDEPKSALFAESDTKVSVKDGSDDEGVSSARQDSDDEDEKEKSPPIPSPFLPTPAPPTAPKLSSISPPGPESPSSVSSSNCKSSAPVSPPVLAVTAKAPFAIAPAVKASALKAPAFKAPAVKVETTPEVLNEDDVEDDDDLDFSDISKKTDDIDDMSDDDSDSHQDEPGGFIFEEKMPGAGKGLRRQGSFTGRSRPPPSAPPTGEGEAPKLGRRRSYDAVGGSDAELTKSGSKPSGSASGTSGVLAMRRTFEKMSEEKRGDAEPVSIGKRKSSLNIDSMTALMMNDMSSDSTAAAETSAPSPRSRRSEATGSDFLSKSGPRRAARGVPLDDEGDEFGIPPAGRVGSSKERLSVAAKERAASTSKERFQAAVREKATANSAAQEDAGDDESKTKLRRLPRAPAFVKGDVRLPRGNNSSGSPPNPGVSGAGAGGVAAGGSRPRSLPRTKGNKSMRLGAPRGTPGGLPGVGDIARRANRFGKRDIQLSLDDDDLGLDDDDDLFGSFDANLVEEDVNSGSGSRGGSSKASQRRNPVDIEPVSVGGKTRPSQRILESAQLFSGRKDGKSNGK